LIEMIAFGYALDNDVKHMSMMVLNEDRTSESRQFIDRFVNTETFRVVGEVQNVEQLASEIRKGNAYVGLQIPPHFTTAICAAGFQRRCRWLIDVSNSTTALPGAQHRRRAHALASASAPHARNRHAPCARSDGAPRRCSTTPTMRQSELLRARA
jgi:hypothetical protein